MGRGWPIEIMDHRDDDDDGSIVRVFDVTDGKARAIVLSLNAHRRHLTQGAEAQCDCRQAQGEP